jgi:nitroreductase
METLENIFSRRSVRSFTEEVLPEETLETIIRAAAAAPTASNAQPWAFLAVRDARRLDALRALSPGIIGRPTAVVVMCLDRRRRQLTSEGVFDEMAWIDIGAALENLLLSAHDMGLGGCPIGSFHKAGVASFLRLPKDLEPVLLVTLGRPRVVPSAPRKRPLEEVYFRETYEE